jgi:hypothetical protein
VSDPTVVLRLVGTGPADRLLAWVEALGRATASSRALHLTDTEPDDDLRRWCAEAGVEVGVEVGAATDADVVVVAAAHDLPTPGTLRRLVSATAASGEPHQTRVLPWGATADGPDAEPTPAPVVCVAFPAGADQGADATDVRRLESAAVFVDRRVDGTTAPAVTSGDPPPYGHPAALPATALHLLLRQTGLPTPELPAALEERPFLTVLTRTQGTRLLLLEETLTCLAGQSNRDFEVVLGCHRVGPEALAGVRDVVAAAPAWLRDRVRVLEVARAGRSAPLNDALDAARGRYAVMLDDDDAVGPDWVAAFATLEARAPGTVLRSVALAQDVRPVPVPGLGPAPVEAGPAHPVWPDEFSLTDHLWDNASPPMTFAVPRGVFTDLGHRFDEALDTTEDWDFLLRAAIVTGVTSTRAVTAAYRVWTEDEGSRHLHDESHWARGREALLRSLDEQVALLPPGAAQGIRDLQRALLDERAEKFRFASLNEQAAADLVSVNEAVVALRARVAELEERLARQRRRRQEKQGRTLD